MGIVSCSWVMLNWNEKIYVKNITKGHCLWSFRTLHCSEFRKSVCFCGCFYVWSRPQKQITQFFFLWDRLLFAFKPQVNKKQLQVYCKLWTEARSKREKKKSKWKKDRRSLVESSSLSPPASAISTIPQSITVALLFPFPFLFSFSFVRRHFPLFCKVNSGEWINSLSTVHVACEQLRVTGLCCFHRPSVYHHRVAIPLPLPLLLLLRLETLFTVRGRTGSDPNLKALDRSDPVK